MRRIHLLLCSCAFVPALAWADPVVFNAAGFGAASIQPTVDAFRGALGDLNANVAGSFGTGRREINWDGVPDAFSAPNLLPANFFNVNSPRGAVFSTPGTGFQVSANAASGVPVLFGQINPLYTTEFATFSPQRLFTALDSNIVDVSFFVPGSSDAAWVRGFGAVFTDVDIANGTTIQYFGQGGQSLGTFAAAAMPGAGSLSFLGVLFTFEQVTKVRITSGNVALGPNPVEDAVAMDDFIYAEPLRLAVAIPEPSTHGLLALGLVGVGWWVRRRRDAAGT